MKVAQLSGSEEYWSVVRCFVTVRSLSEALCAQSRPCYGVFAACGRVVIAVFAACVRVGIAVFAACVRVVIAVFTACVCV